MRRGAARGFTLIETMVALAIGMLLALAVFGVMSTFEGRRRTLGASAELEQAGTLAVFQLERLLRSAGSGFNEIGAFAYGCPLHAARGGIQLLPASAGLEAPFANVDPGGGIFRLMPVLILPGQTTPGASGQPSDALLVMTANAAAGQVATRFAEPAGASQLTLVQTLAFGPDDLLLLAERQTGAPQPCLVSQVASSHTGSGQTLPLGGQAYAASVASTAVTGYANPRTGLALALGNPALGTAPALLALGVGDNDTLFSLDLLRASTPPLQARAEGIFELHALYGIDSNNDNRIDAWRSPASGAYSVAALSDGSATATAAVRSIKALRIGLILRTALPERDDGGEPVSGASISLFGDLDAALQFTRSFTRAERSYRYHAVEATIALRNNLL